MMGYGIEFVEMGGACESYPLLTVLFHSVCTHYICGQNSVFLSMTVTLSFNLNQLVDEMNDE